MNYTVLRMSGTTPSHFKLSAGVPSGVPSSPPLTAKTLFRLRTDFLKHALTDGELAEAGMSAWAWFVRSHRGSDPTCNFT